MRIGKEVKKVKSPKREIRKASKPEKSPDEQDPIKWDIANPIKAPKVDHFTSV